MIVQDLDATYDPPPTSAVMAGVIFELRLGQPRSALLTC